ncbi:MAG: hypothetical protein RLY78_3892 [Pseudomonadota bacterium]
MRFDHLELIRFGKFTDQRLDLPAAPQDFHLVVGPNEAGKSTLRRAVAELLFGMPLRSDMDFLHPLAELRLGAQITSEAGTLAVQRARGRKPLRRAADDTPLPDDALRPHLGAATELLYRRMFCLDLNGLIEGGRSILDAADDVGQLLFQSAAGLGGLGTLRDALAAEADALYAPRKSGSRAFYAALDLHDGARQSLRAATVNTRAWSAAAAEVTRLEAELAQAGTHWQQLSAQRVTLERVRRVAPRLAQWQAAVEARAALEAEPELRTLPADAAHRLDEAERALAHQRAAHTLHERAVAEGRVRLEGLNPEAAVLAQAAAIEALAGQLPTALRQQRELERCADELQSLLQALQSGAQALGWPGDEARLRAVLPAAAQLKALEQLQRQAATLRQSRHTAQMALQRAQQQCERLDEAVRPAATQSVPAADLAAALQDAQSLRSGVLRRRQQSAALAQAGLRLQAAWVALGPAAPVGPHGAAVTAVTAEIGAASETGVTGLTGDTRDIRDTCNTTEARDAAALDRLAALTPPSDEHLNALKAERAERLAARHSAEREADEAAERARRAALALAQSSAGSAVITATDVRAARGQRDGLWAGLRDGARPLAEVAVPLEQAIGRADELADRQQAQATEAAQLQSLRDAAAREQAQAESAQARHTAAQQALDAVEARWAQRRAACGLPDLALLDAADWLAARREVLAAASALQAARADQAAEQQAIATTAQRLQQALADSGVPPADDGPPRKASVATPAAAAAATPDLAELCAAAEACLQQHQAALAGAAAHQRQWADAQAELAQATLQAAATDEALRDWQTRWQAAVSAAGLDEAWHGPEAAEAAIEQARALHARCDEIDTLRTRRMRTLQQDIAACIALADDLRGPLPGTATHAHAPARPASPAPAATPHDPADDHLRLQAARQRADAAQQALQQARRLQQARDHALDELARHAQALEAATLAIAATEATLQALFEQAGTRDLAVLRQRIEASDRLRTLQTEVTAQQHGLLEAGDGLDLAALQAEARAHPASGLKPALEAIDQALAEAVEQRGRLSAALAQARAELARTEGGDAAALAEGRRLEALAQMGEAAERYIHVATASRLLRWAIDRYRERRQGPLLARASTLFTQLTLGRHARLATDVEQQPPRLLAVRDSGERVGVEGLSEGTRDQLFLALRLAALELQIASDRPLPFIADDLFVNFHDARSRAGLAVLGELSRRTQVIFLTHHEHLVDVAREAVGAAINVVRLEPR